jgi:hypothetical protein
MSSALPRTGLVPLSNNNYPFLAILQDTPEAHSNISEKTLFFKGYIGKSPLNTSSQMQIMLKLLSAAFYNVDFLKA